jgi:hypothetical protein
MKRKETTMSRWKIAVAAAGFALTACAGPPVAVENIAASARLQCAAVAQPRVPGEHGAYGGFHDERHPYDPHGATQRRPVPIQQSFIDPYFRLGEETADVRAYRDCVRQRGG